VQLDGERLVEGILSTADPDGTKALQESTIRMLGTAQIPVTFAQWPSLTLRPCGQVPAQALLWGQGTHKRLELGAAPLQGAEVLRGRHALIPLLRCTFGEGGRRLLARPRGVLFASSVFVR
jgi:hypothetical protein